MMGHMKSGSTRRRKASSALRSVTCCRTRSRSACTSETCTATSSWNCSKVASFRARRSSGESKRGEQGVPAPPPSSSGSRIKGKAVSASCSLFSASCSCSESACTRSPACVTRSSYCRSKTAPAVAPIAGFRGERKALEACVCLRCFRSSVWAASSSSSAARLSRSNAGSRCCSATASRSSARRSAKSRSFGTKTLVQATSWLATSPKRCVAWPKACSQRRTCRRCSQTTARQALAWAPKASYSSNAYDQDSCWLCNKSPVSCWRLWSESCEARAKCGHSVPEDSTSWFTRKFTVSSSSRATRRHSPSCSAWICWRFLVALRHSTQLLWCSGPCASNASQRAVALCCSKARSAGQELSALRTRWGTRTVRHEAEPLEQGLTSRSAPSNQSRYRRVGTKSGESSSSAIRFACIRRPCGA
mmetsp:Transcript_75153/g.242999  ORF Transcript_75153/g.242999 Transcript_75153/m.242999 type:complete len:418 (-) Transcript_75153:822-2075(-)